MRLFHEAMVGVRRLRPVAPPPRPHKPRKRLHKLETVQHELPDLYAALATMETGEVMSYLLKGHSLRLLHQLRRGRFEIQDELDLHHMSVSTARTYIADFLAEACQHGLRCVRIVHGKGLHSASGGPVLKTLTNYMLRRHHAVLAFATTRPEQGGTGAVLVLLRNHA